MDYLTKLVYQSNYWYNDALEKARIRDMSGAIASLKKSLQYNNSNIAARNLLGLVYYGRGDVAEALVEWILSKNIKSHENIANYYIGKMQENPPDLEEINDAIKKYNQSLNYARNGGEDLAIIQLKKAVDEHPSYVRAYQLLAFLYIHTEQYAAARKVLKKAFNLDRTDELTLRYMHELKEIRKERPITYKNSKRKNNTVSYHLGNETIIQPAYMSQKENNGLSTLLNMSLGIVIGVLVMWFLVFPQRMAERQQDINRQIVDFSDRIAEQEAQISALKKELELFRVSSEQTEDAKTTAVSTQSSYEVILNVLENYRNSNLSDEAMTDQLLTVNRDSLGTAALSAYEEMTGELYPRMCRVLYQASRENNEVANYAAGIENMEKVMKMDENYDEGGGMFLLAELYRGNGETEKAGALYQKIADKFPENEVGEKSRKALEENTASGSGEEAAQ